MQQHPIGRNLKNLVIVPGHAVYEGQNASDAYDGSKWIGTYDGYKYNDEVCNYVRHIQRGINLADFDSKSLLVFSGGKTRKGTIKSEAESYYTLANQLEWFGMEPNILQRVRLEEFATDSFENLLFSIQLFQLLHPDDKYPLRVTVVGLRFKKKRYKMHADAIILNSYKDIPPFVFRYDDVNDIPDYVLEGGSAEGEELTRLQFQIWPYGNRGKLLEKRMQRDPYDWHNQKPYR